MDYKKIHSLLPYLKSSEGNFSLQISLAGPEFPPADNIADPFLLIDDADPLAKVIGAEVVSDNGATVLPVFLQIQRDEYRLKENDLLPLTNTSIEQCWQQAFQAEATTADSGKTFSLAAQIDDSGQAFPLQSLFFCKNSKVFFHPPCPNCGGLLQLCRDEALLAAAELESFNDSLRRYLYCPDCQGKTENSIYSLTRFPSDPPIVAAKPQLLAKYRQALSLGIADTNLPCQNCDNKTACCQPQDPELSAIAVFSFYPFFMQIFPSGSLAAHDYLTLLAGAEPEVIQKKLAARQQTGRILLLKKLKSDFYQNKYLLPENPDKNFLEILYLKITFLEAFCQNYLKPGEAPGFLDPGNALAGTWVIFSPDSLLPGLWSFKLSRHDIGRFIPTVINLPDHSPENTFHSLGLLWFQTLTTNSQQKTPALYNALKQMLRLAEADHNSDFKTLSAAIEPHIFQPDQLFWTPNRVAISAKIQKIWEQCLATGWDFFQPPTQPEPGLIHLDLFKKLKQTRQEIKKQLFAETASPLSPAATRPKTDLTNILTGIENKWQTLKTTSEPETPRQQPAINQPEAAIPTRKEINSEPDEDMEETIIISAGKPDLAALFPDNPPNSTFKEDTEETIIIGSENIKKRPTNYPPQPDLRQETTPSMPEPAWNSDDLPPTIHGGQVVKQPAAPADSPLGTPIFKPVDELEETIIISADKPAPSVSGPNLRQPVKAPPPPAPKDDLAETIIISPQKKQ